MASYDSDSAASVMAAAGTATPRSTGSTGTDSLACSGAAGIGAGGGRRRPLPLQLQLGQPPPGDRASSGLRHGPAPALAQHPSSRPLPRSYSGGLGRTGQLAGGEQPWNRFSTAAAAATGAGAGAGTHPGSGYTTTERTRSVLEPLPPLAAQLGPQVGDGGGSGSGARASWFTTSASSSSTRPPADRLTEASGSALGSPRDGYQGLTSGLGGLGLGPPPMAPTATRHAQLDQVAQSNVGGVDPRRVVTDPSATMRPGQATSFSQTRQSMREPQELAQLGYGTPPRYAQQQIQQQSLAGPRVSPLAERYLPRNQGIAANGSPLARRQVPERPQAEADVDERHQVAVGHGAEPQLFSYPISRESSVASEATSFNLPPIPKSLSESSGFATFVDDGAAAADVDMLDEPMPPRTAMTNGGYLTPSQSYSAQLGASAAFSPGTPGPVDPTLLDRQGLVGTGELATPRWTRSHRRDQSVGTGVHPEMAMAAASLSNTMSALPADGSFTSATRRTASIALPALASAGNFFATQTLAAEEQVPRVPQRLRSTRNVSGPRQRVPSGPARPTQDTYTPPMHLTVPASDSTSSSLLASPMLELPTSWGDLSMSSSLDNAFDEIAKKVDAPASRMTAVGGTPPGSARGKRPAYSPRIASDLDRLKDTESRRRANPAAGSPPVGMSQRPSRTDLRVHDNLPREHKLSSTTIRHMPSHTELTPGQFIIRQYSSTRDFSHLPPSPSTASINQFMLRESASHHSFSPMLDSPSSSKQAASSSALGQIRSTPSVSSMRSSRARDMGDRDKAETIRRLDGLGKTSTGTLKRPASRDKKQSHESGDTSRHEGSGSEGDISRREKRASSSSTSAGNLTPRTPSNQSSAPGSANPAIAGQSWAFPRRSSVISEGPDDTFRSWEGESGSSAVPPVPPLPKNLSTPSRASSAGRPQTTHELPKAAEYVPIKEAAPAPSRQSDSRSRLSNSASSPALGVDSNTDLTQNTGLSSPILSDDGSLKPRRMSKKWSFSSALSGLKGKQPQLSDDELGSPRAGQFEQLVVPSPTFPHASLLPSTSIGSMSDLMRVPSAQTQSDATVAPQRPVNNRKSSGSSGLPFFRRTSSSSVSTKGTSAAMKSSKSSQGLDTAAADRGASLPTAGNRKTVLGIGISSLLKGSGSRRNLSVTDEGLMAAPPVNEDFGPVTGKKSSLGWSSRKRGKTFSISSPPEAAKPLPPVQAENLDPNASRGDSLRKRPSRERLGVLGAENMRPSASGLPSIVGSPSGPPSADPSARARDTQGTPTKIPRLIPKAPAQATSATPSISTTPLPSRLVPRSIGARSSLPVSRDRLPAEFSKHELGQVGRDANNAHSPRIDDSPSTDIAQPVHHRKAASMLAPNKRNLPDPPQGKGPLPATPSDRAAPPIRDDDGFLRPAIASIKATNSRLPSSHSTPALSATRTQTRHEAPIGRTTPASEVLVDEDELQGDAEMANFLRVQKAKRAADPSRKSDLDAFLNFPDPGQPRLPVSPHAFIKAHFETLSQFERREILDYSAIWFSGGNIHKSPAVTDSSVNNYGYDDDRGDYLIRDGDHLAYRYEIMATLGKGSFGQVVMARDHKTGECVAIKIIRNKKRFHSQAVIEVKILENLVKWDPEDRYNMVKITDSLHFRGHLCIVTELLSLNLYELVKANNFVGFSNTLIRRFAVQLLACLQVMRNNRVIHCDLKPENILLKHPAKSAIKVIDFGSSCFEHEKVYTYIQSRFYRSPEIILGKEYSMGIDMWSFGCILAEMFTGFPIFPGENEQEQLACIMEIMGVPDRSFLSTCSRKKVFFDGIGQPRPYVNSKGKRRRPASKTVNAVLRSSDELFVDFISKCLVWDPEKRLKPAQAMKHPWILAGRKVPVTGLPMMRSALTSSATAGNLSQTLADPSRASASSMQSSTSTITPSSSVGAMKSRTDQTLTAGQGSYQDRLKAKISEPSPLSARRSSGANGSAGIAQAMRSPLAASSTKAEKYGHYTPSRGIAGTTRA